MSGSLSVSAPPAVGRRLLLRALSSFCADHPAVRLDLSLGAERVDLIAADVDLAIRFGPLAETWRRARRLLRGAYHVYGEPVLVQRLRGQSLVLRRRRSPHPTHDAGAGFDHRAGLPRSV